MNSLFDLSGKVVLVTGGNTGLGLGFASGVARCGGDIVIWGRREDRNDEAVKTLQKRGAGRVISQCVDVSSEDQVVAGMRDAVAAMGRVDGLVSNAGMASMAPLHEMTTEVYDDLINTNQRGGFLAIREAVRHMKSRSEHGEPGGSIAICGSLTQFVAVPGLAHYGAAKSALQAIMRNVAVEYGRDGIRANMVCAGYFYTSMYMGIPKELLPMDAMLRDRNPIGRWGTPEDLEGIVAYLMGDASSYHTGDVIVIDGGNAATAV